MDTEAAAPPQMDTDVLCQPHRVASQAMIYWGFAPLFICVHP